MSISLKIVHSLTGSETRYIVMQGRPDGKGLYLQIMAPNHPHKNRPYGFSYDIPCSEEIQARLHELMKGA